MRDKSWWVRSLSGSGVTFWRPGSVYSKVCFEMSCISWTVRKFDTSQDWIQFDVLFLLLSALFSPWLWHCHATNVPKTWSHWNKMHLKVDEPKQSCCQTLWLQTWTQVKKNTKSPVRLWASHGWNMEARHSNPDVGGIKCGNIRCYL